MEELKRKEDVIKSFKAFIKIMIVNSACDFKRAYYAKKIETIPFDEYVENKVSLSMFDDGIFFVEKSDIETLMKRIGYKDRITKNEKRILILLQKGYDKKEISKITGIKINTIEQVLCRLRKKMRRDKNDR